MRHWEGNKPETQDGLKHLKKKKKKKKSAGFLQLNILLMTDIDKHFLL